MASILWRKIYRYIYICTCLFTTVVAADTGLLPIAIRGFTLLIYGYKSESSHIKVEYYDNSNSVPLQSTYLPPLKRRAHYQMAIW